MILQAASYTIFVSSKGVINLFCCPLHGDLTYVTDVKTSFVSDSGLLCMVMNIMFTLLVV